MKHGVSLYEDWERNEETLVTGGWKLAVVVVKSWKKRNNNFFKDKLNREDFDAMITVNRDTLNLWLYN